MPDRLIHWRSAQRGQCARRDSGVDTETTQQGRTTIVLSGEADFAGNVTCPTCRRLMREANRAWNSARLRRKAGR